MGAMAFLRRQYTTIAMLAAGTAIVIGVLVGYFDNNFDVGWKTSLAFVVGAFASGLSGFIGMTMAFVPLLTILVITLAVILSNFLADLLYSWLDPRIKLNNKGDTTPTVIKINNGKLIFLCAVIIKDTGKPRIINT